MPDSKGEPPEFHIKEEHNTKHAGGTQLLCLKQNVPSAQTQPSNPTIVEVTTMRFKPQERKRQVLRKGFRRKAEGVHKMNWTGVLVRGILSEVAYSFVT
jgi:hypothetical protein